MNSSDDITNVTKQTLFKIAKKCALAFKLPTNFRYILEQLVGVYGNIPVEERLLVWPSNALLEKRTGIAERSIRFALSKLLDLGLIKAKDSANGKRFAQRLPHGQIIRAFVFDLMPLVERENECNPRVADINNRSAEISAAFDEITVYRRITITMVKLRVKKAGLDPNDFSAHALQARLLEKEYRFRRQRNNLVTNQCSRQHVITMTVNVDQT